MPINLQQRRQLYNGEKKVSSVSGAGKTGQLYIKEHSLMPHTHTHTHTHKVKMDQGPKYNIGHYKILREKEAKYCLT